MQSIEDKLSLNYNTLIKDYNDLGSLTKIAKKYDVSVTSISNCFNRLNISFKKSNKIYLNEEVFSSINPKSLYWMGYLAADGNVYKNYINLTIAEKDLDHLLKYKRDLSSEHKIYKKSKIIKDKKFISYCVQFFSKKVAQDLSTYSIIPNKSKILQFPSNIIDDPNINIYCRGYFDGDGCWRTIRHLNWSKQLIFELAGTEKFLREFNNILFKNNIGNLDKILYKNNGIYVLSYQGNNICTKIVKWLYKDILQNPSDLFLHRKFNLIKDYLTE